MYINQSELQEREMGNTTIYGKNRSGTRTSISIDSLLWSLVVASHKDEDVARDWARTLMEASPATATVSKYVQRACIARVAKPSLMRAIEDSERQIDIDEL